MINLIPSLGHPSVAVVIYNKESDKLVLVKQLRPAVLFTELMNDASITSVNDMVKANDALKSNYIYFCIQAYDLWHCHCILDFSTLSCPRDAARFSNLGG